MNVMLAALLSAALATAPAPASAAAPADSPLVGQWLLDVDSLPMPPEARPKRVDLVFAATPDGRWNERVRIVGQDDKIMSVAINDPNFAHVHELKDLAPHLLREVEHFFLTYKDLEEKDVHSDGWEGREAALAFVNQCVAAYKG